MKIPGPTVWLTRDSFGGEVEDHVDVWECRPTRHERDGGFVEWLDVGDGLGMHAEQISLADAKIRFRTVPDDDRQIIRVGR